MLYLTDSELYVAKSSRIRLLQFTLVTLFVMEFTCIHAAAQDSQNDLIAKLRSKCGVNLDDDSFNYYSSTRIPYNSKLGRDLRKCFDIPKPPLQTVDSSLVNPPRTVDPKNWNSTYCKAWNDNKTECRRSSRYSNIECSPVSSNTPLPFEEIKCNGIFDVSEIGELCSNLTTYVLRIDRNSTISISIFNETNWYYEYNVELKLWSSKMYDGSNNNFIKENDSGRKLAYDYVCKNSYEEENSESVVINLGDNQ